MHPYGGSKFFCEIKHVKKTPDSCRFFPSSVGRFKQAAGVKELFIRGCYLIINRKNFTNKQNQIQNRIKELLGLCKVMALW